MIESELVEFKKTTRELNEAVVSISSMLNKHKKGTIYFGVKNNGEPVKFEINDSTLRDISRKIYESIKPQIFPVIELDKINGVEVIKVSFEGEGIPYSAFGKYYIRVADEDRELTPSELRKIMISREYEENWCNHLSNYSIEHVDGYNLKRFYDNAVGCGRLPDIGYNKETLLKKHNLYRNGKLTNAGLMLFGDTNPISLKLVVFATSERTTILDMKFIKGNIFTLINEAMDFIIKNIRWKVVIDETSVQRKEIPEIPLVALRECVINSFAHARYDGNVQHEIDIYSNRVSIINPGSFANDYSPIDFFEKNLKSYLRNEPIAEILYLCKDVETCGHGLKKVYNLCNEVGVEISYVMNEGDFTIEFSRDDRNKSGEINGEINGEISNEEMNVLNVFKTNKNAIKKDVIEKTGYSSRTIDRIISSLKKKALIVRVGSNKTGYRKTI